MKTIISIEGNIGAGKTTLIEELERQYNNMLVVILEPVQEWKIGEENFLELFYNDPIKYAYEFQKIVLLSQINGLKKEIERTEKKIIVCDRSFETTIKVFSSLMLENELLKIEEFEELQNIMKSVNISFTKIYLKTDPEICLERIKMRNRPEEKYISLDYLFDLERKHNEMLKNTIVLDGNKDFINDETIKNEYLKTILKIANI